jgi:uncharacterized membrane protein
VTLEEAVREAVGYIALCVEASAVLVATIGVFDTLGRIGAAIVRRTTGHGTGKLIWRRFALWLLLALEFALAADIIRSVISPTWEDIGELAAIAAIRTFLNYFLEKDLDASREAAPVEG